jgi:16S rRNA processing protein RimM
LLKKSDILKYKDFFLENNKKIVIKFFSTSKNILGVIDEIKDLEKAKKFIGKKILIEKENLPKLNRNQFYFNDLISLKVYVKKKKLGTVSNVKNHGAGDYLEIINNKDELLVPINNYHIQSIDLENNKILLNPEYYDF